MKIDWQRFDDGLLGPEERDRAIAALTSDPAAKRELEGLRSFKAAVRESALSEPVPIANLEARLRQIVLAPSAVPKRPPIRLPLIAAAAAIAILLVAAIVVWMPEGNSVSEDTVRVSSESEARQIAANRSGMSVPPIDIGSIGKIQGVHAGKLWACYDYNVDGQVIHLGIDAAHCNTDGLEEVETTNGTVFIDDLNKTVHFSKGNLYFAVYGADQDARIAVAERALKSLSEN